jgi:hypothetical protein
MNEPEKALVQYLKLNYGLCYENGNFITSRPIVNGGQLKLERYTDQILIYEPIEDNSSNSAWKSFVNKFSIRNDSLEFEKIKDQTSLLAKTDIKLIIPVLRITYFGEPFTDIESSIDKQPIKSSGLSIRENYQEFLPREVLVGGFLIIKNGLKYSKNPLEFDQLKARIVWTVNEACWKSKNLFKSEIMHSKLLKDIEDSNGNPIHDMESLVCNLVFHTRCSFLIERIFSGRNYIISVIQKKINPARII